MTVYSIHLKLLKSLADDFAFAESLTNLFRVCAESGHIPEIWKTANITALFKNGSKTDPLNYRPVSLRPGVRGVKNSLF